MKNFTVKTTCVAAGCLLVACFAMTAQAETTALGGVPVGVNDALLASTRAVNLRQSIVANIPGTGAGAVVPLHAALATANNVRLWDEVVPPMPLPTPTQVSMALPDAPHMTATTSRMPQMSHVSPPALASGMQPTTLSVNAGVGRIPTRLSR